MCLVTRAGTPRPVIDKINGVLTPYLQRPEVQDRLNGMVGEAWDYICGHLALHTSTAQAVAKTIVSPVSESEFERLVRRVYCTLLALCFLAQHALSGEAVFDLLECAEDSLAIVGNGHVIASLGSVQCGVPFAAIEQGSHERGSE